MQSVRIHEFGGLDSLKVEDAPAEAGRLAVHVDATFPLDEVHKAHEMSKAGHTRGKVVLRAG